MPISTTTQTSYVKNLTTWPTGVLSNGVKIDGPFSWTGNSNTSYTVKYSTLPSLSWASGGVMVANATAKALSADQMTAFSTIRGNLSNVTNISWTNTNNAPDLVVSQIKLASGGIIVPNKIISKSNLEQADVFIPDNYATFKAGSPGYKSLLHEVMHSMGLSHPNADGYNKAYNQDFTAMSYNTGSEIKDSFPITPMLYDIAALQFLYGVNRTDVKNTIYNAANALYPINGSKVAMTIWDAGGTDTLDASTIAGNHVIDLRGGVAPDGKVYFSKIGDERVAIAFDPNNTNTSKVVDIENGFGGAGADTIYGGYADNLLKGNGAADTIIGWGGKDTIYGGAGNDSLFVFKQNAADKPLNTTTIGTVFGEAGNDTIIGDNGNDTLDGGADNDIVKGGKGNDTIKDSAGANGLYGESGSDTIIGGKNNDTIVGGSNTADGFPDNDSIKGGDGADYILGGSGEDTIWGGIGNDTLEGGPGRDLLIGEGGDDTILVTSSTDWVRPDGGFNTVNLVRAGFVTDPFPIGAFISIPNINNGNGVLKFDGSVVSGEIDLDNNTLGSYSAYAEVAVLDNDAHTLCPGGFIMISEEPIPTGGSASASNLAVFINNFQDGKYGITLPDWFWEY